jgi:outer membrane protein assembly factor BamB
LAVALIAAGSAAASAADWPRFRGPNGTGTAPDTNFPVKFSASEHLLWKAAIPGSGASSPIVSAGKVFVQSASPDGRERFLICLDAKDGKEAWRRAIPGGAAKTHKKNTLASSTPAADGRSVYAVFWDGESITVHAFDFAGKPLWNRSLGGFKSQHGAGESPVVHGGKVFVNHDQDGAARLVALDAATGAVAWEQTRKPYRACYSTPFLHKRADGTEELIVASTAGIAGHDPAGGRQNWVWNWDWSDGGRPLRTVGSPVAAEGLIFLSSGDGAGDRAMVAIKADGAAGDVSASAKVWGNTKSVPYVPSMLASGPHLFFVNDRGIAACHVAKTGEQLWAERLGGNVSASPILAEGRIYAATEEGDVYVFEAAGKYKLLARNSIGEPLFATPAASDGRLYVRGSKHLFCFGGK